MLQVKDYENRPMLLGAIQKIKVARFYRPRCIAKNNLSLSSAAFEASSSFSVAACSRFSVPSNSSSRLRTFFVNVCTSPSAYQPTQRTQ